MTANNKDVAIFVSPRKREIYPLKLSGLNTLTQSLSTWKATNLEGFLLLDSGELLKIVDATISDSSTREALKRFWPYLSVSLEVKMVDANVVLEDFLQIVADGAADQIQSFGSDEDMSWKLLRLDKEEARGKILSCNDLNQLVHVLEFPEVSECLPNL